MREWWDWGMDWLDRALVGLANVLGAGADVLADRAVRRLQERQRRRRMRRARAELARRDPHEDASGWRP